MKLAITLATLLGSTAAIAAPAGKPLPAVLHELGTLSLGPGRTLCPRVSELEAAFGPLHYRPRPDAMANLAPLALPTPAGATSASLGMIFDIYHQDPSKVTDPTVGTVTIVVDATVLADVEAMFAGPGAAHHVIAGDDIAQLGDLYFRPQTREVVLSCARTPAWAQVPWTAAAAATYGRAVAAYAKAPSEAAWRQIALPELEATQTPTSFSIVFRSPLPGAALLTALGATQVIETSVDVHMSSFRLAHADGSPIIAGGFRIAISIDDTGVEHHAGPGATARSAPIPLARLAITSINADKIQ